MKRYLEFFGMLLLGDGLLTMLDTRRHCVLWEKGPKAWRQAVSAFADHPNASRMAGLFETALGFWLARQQKPSLVRYARHPRLF